MAPSLSTFLLVCSITQLYGFTVRNIEIHDDYMNLIKFQKFRTANTPILEALWISLDFKFSHRKHSNFRAAMNLIKFQIFRTANIQIQIPYN